jgi:AraC-like DNA-binding protein
MTAAKEHLSLPLLSVKEIAGAVGYGFTSSFDREFKRVHGCTPTEWRNAVTGVCSENLVMPQR